MTIDDLKILGDRLRHGPVPTQAKKVYAYLGRMQDLLRSFLALSPSEAVCSMPVRDAICLHKRRLFPGLSRSNSRPTSRVEEKGARPASSSSTTLRSSPATGCQ